MKSRSSGGCSGRIFVDRGGGRGGDVRHTSKYGTLVVYIISGVVKVVVILVLALVH